MTDPALSETHDARHRVHAIRWRRIANIRGRIAAVQSILAAARVPMERARRSTLPAISPACDRCTTTPVGTERGPDQIVSFCYTGLAADAGVVHTLAL